MFETNWAFRKPQNAHTRKTAYTFFCILQLIYKENRTNGSFQNRNQTEPAVFLKTETKPNLKNPFRTSLYKRLGLKCHGKLTYNNIRYLFKVWDAMNKQKNFIANLW